MPLLAVALLATVAPAADPRPFPTFTKQEIATDLKIGYAVQVCDVNGDGKPDIVVVDQHRVVWYENPSWKVRTVLKGKTKPDNVCLCPLDIDGDGKLDFVLGAGWKPADTNTPGTLQWLRRGKSLDDEWEMFPIACDEPTVHRVKAIDLNRDGKPEVVVAPLMGRGSTAKGSWLDGRAVRLLAYPVPKTPTDPKAWVPRVLNEELNVLHNIEPVYQPWGKQVASILTASSRGVTALWIDTNTGLVEKRNPITTVDPTAGGPQAASEVADGQVTGKSVTAAVEPWHGNTITVYLNGMRGGPPADRLVLDKALRWGHALKFADLDGDGHDELIAGVRDDPAPKAGDTFPDRRGVRVYRPTADPAQPWERHILEDGGVAVEDLAVADLDGDGRPDIVAVGRATGNCRIYWNRK